MSTFKQLHALNKLSGSLRRLLTGAGPASKEAVPQEPHAQLPAGQQQPQAPEQPRQPPRG